jgi:hypothetical protein
VIQLTRKGVLFRGTERDLESQREKYDQENYVILPRLYEPSLLDQIMQRVEAAPFYPRDHAGIGAEFCMDDEITAALLMFLPNDPAFLRLVERITGQHGIGEFIGRVYRLTASDGHYDNWHDDNIGRRVVTMSVNLSRRVFSGGALQMKYHGSPEILQEVRNTGFGDALLFRISEKLTHRVQSVTGDIPKTAFAGWFLQGDDFMANLRQRFNLGCAK